MYSHHADNGGNTASAPPARKRTVLLEINGWQLVRPFFPKVLGINSYPIHVKCGNTGSGVYRNTDGHPGLYDKCSQCNSTVPDEIMAMWALHNWDKATE